MKRLAPTSIQTPPKLYRQSQLKKRKPKRYVSKPGVVSVGRQAFPPILRNTLVYTELVSIPLSALGIGLYQFRANGMYDPNYTSTGNQPMFFDELCGVYNHYVVLSAKCTIQQYTQNDFACSYTLWVDDDTTVAGGPATSRARTDAVSMICNTNNQTSPELSVWYNAKKMFGGDPTSGDQQQGTSGSDPSELAFFDIHVLGDTIASPTIKVMVTIEYNCQWSEWKTNGGS